MKQVECIDNEKLSAGKKVSLTLGKVYNLISECSPDYTVFDDEGMQRSYMKSRFKDVQPELWVEYEGWFDAVTGEGAFWDKGVPYKVVGEDQENYSALDKNGKKTRMSKTNARIVPAPSKKIVGYRHKATGYKFYLTGEQASDRGKFVTEDKKIGTASFYIPHYIIESDYDPFYQDPKPDFKIIQVGNITVKISKGKIEADGKEWSAKRLEGMINRWVWNDHKCEATSWKIGCQTITREQIEQVVDEYEKINQ